MIRREAGRCAAKMPNRSNDDEQYIRSEFSNGYANRVNGTWETVGNHPVRAQHLDVLWRANWSLNTFRLRFDYSVEMTWLPFSHFGLSHSNVVTRRVSKLLDLPTNSCTTPI